MKKVLLFLSSMIVVAILGMFALPNASKAQTTMADGVICPTGMTCTRSLCPVGYNCTPNTVGNTTFRSTTVYTPGSYTNLILRPQGQTLTPAQIQAAAQTQAQASTLVQGSVSLAQIQGYTSTSSNLVSNYNGVYVTAAEISSNRTVAEEKARAATTAIENSITTGNPSVRFQQTSSRTGEALEWIRAAGTLILPSNLCKHPIPDYMALVLKQQLSAKGINADILTSSSTMYVNWNIGGAGWGLFDSAIGARLLAPGTIPDFTWAAPTFARCLDEGFVSNYPAYITNFTAFVNSHRSPPTHIMRFGETLGAGGVLVPAPNYQ